ncbi:MAG: hypothetical protein ROW52_09185, partial [Anaerolineaceae bacterium]
MESTPLLRYIIAGQLRREYVITPDGKARVDVLGGNLSYAAVGAAIWEGGIGLISRVSEDYPRAWLAEFGRWGFDCQGIRILPESIDLRSFTVFTGMETRHN